MKNLLLIVCLTFLSASFINLKSSRPTGYYQEDKQIRGYVIVQGGFKEMRLTFRLSGNTWFLYKWEMVEPIDYRNSWGYGGEKRLIPLNYQNQLAIKYNFTHYIETTYGNAYVTLNQ